MVLVCFCVHGADTGQDMLASYKDVKEKPCRTCGKLLDHRAMFPVVRRRKSTKNEDGTWKSNWEALHEDCS